MTDILDLMDDAERRAGATNLASGVAQNPDRAAEADRLGRETGLPPDTAARNLDQVRRRANAQAGAQALAASPPLRQWAAADPGNAAVSHDELPHLGGLTDWVSRAFHVFDIPQSVQDTVAARTLQTVGQLWTGGAALVDSYGRLAGEAAMRETGATAPGQERPLYPRAAADVRPLRDAAAALRPKNPSTVDKIADTAAGLVLPMASAMIPVVGPALAAGEFGALGADQAKTDADAKGATGDSADAAVVGSGIVQAGLGLVAPEAIAGRVLPKLLRPAQAALEKLGLGSLLEHPAAQTGGKLVSAGAGGAGLGTAMTVGQNAVEKATIDPDKPLGEGVAESASTMGAVSLLLHGATHLADHATQVSRAADDHAASLAGIDNFDQAVEAVRGAKLTERSPERLKTLLQTVAPDGRVYVPGEKVAEYLQKLSPADQQKFLADTGVADQVGPAMAGGGDVVFDAADYLTHVAPGDAHDAFKDDYRLSLDGQSRREAAEFEGRFDQFVGDHGKALADEAQASAEASAPAERVYQDVFRQYREAGNTLDAARQYAALWAERYAARAERLGTDAWGEYQRAGAGGGVRIQQELPEPLGRNYFGREDVVIDALRRARSPKQDQGPSLLEHLAKSGGLADPQGELAAMDADKWRKPFTAKLVKEDGRSLEDAAVAAQEAGYLPERAGEGDNRAQPADLLDAIRGELSGKPRYAVPKDEARADFKEAVDQLDEVLGRLGINPETATNEEIKRALAEYRADGGDGLEFLQMAGTRSATAPMEALGRAQIMEGEGALPGVIFDETGWQRGDDRRWRYEISDHEAAFTDKGKAALAELFHLADRGDRFVRLGDILQHDRLFEAYPWLRHIGVRVERSLGGAKAAYASDIGIGVSERSVMEALQDPAKWSGILSSVLHEVQHAIQDAEGFARGAPSSAEAMRKSAYADALYEEVQRIRADEGGGDWATQEREAAYNIYRRSAGEIEARNTQTRQSMTEQGRRDLPPDFTRDIQPGEALVRLTVGGRSSEALLEPVRRSFEQPDGSLPDPRGSVTFPIEGPALIRFFANRDLSTGLHEPAHLWLEELRADAGRADAPEQIKADMEATWRWWDSRAEDIAKEADVSVEDVRRWAERRVLDGTSGTDWAITTAAHEQWARGFESYLLEGRAPSEALRGAFQRFKAWLTQIYRTVASLNVHISDEMRAVFDRLVATDDEIKRARALSGYKPADPTLLGMTPAEGGAYHAAALRANESAHDAVLKRVMGDIRRRRTKEWADQRASVRDEVSSEVEARPDVRALHYLTRGEMLGVPEGEQPGRVKLSARDVADIYGSDSVLDLLPRAVPPIYAKEGGVHPDDIAPLFGYRSGEAMLNAIMALEHERRARVDVGDKRSARSFLIDQATDRTMAERHGDALTDGSIEEEALAAIHDDRAGELLAAELRALSRKAGGEPTSIQIAQRWAEDYVQGRKVRELQPHVYLRAERKAARAFEEALVKGDDTEALAQKERQVLNHVLFREATKAQEAADKTVAALGKLAGKKTMPSMAQEYLDQIHGLLERFDFNATRKEADRRTGLAEFVKAREAAGEVVVVPPQLLSDAYRTSYHDMTVEELQGLGDTVTSLAHLGRLKKKLLVAKAERDFDDLVDEVRRNTDGLKVNWSDHTADRRRRGRLVRKIDASLLKVETISDMLDRDDPNGPFNRVLIQPAQDAAIKANDLRDSVLYPLAETYRALPREVRRSWLRRVDTPELLDVADVNGERHPLDLQKLDVIGMALNSGNEGNWRKMVEGWGWDEAATRRVLDRVLTKDDWAFVQAAWDHVGKLWPDIARVEKRLTGLEPEKVAPWPVETPHGVFDGGYWPVVYDPDRTPQLDELRSKEASDLFYALHVSAATPKGHTVSRTGFKGPVLLNPHAVLNDHLNKVVTRIAYGEFVQSAKRFIESKRIRQIVSEKVGPEYHAEMMPWLQAQVGYRLIDPRAVHWVDKFLRAARTNATTAMAAVNPVVWAEHASAFPQSASVLGPRWLAAGFSRYLSRGGPFMAAREIYERSPMMRQRMNEATREIRDMQDKLRAREGLFQKAEDATGLPLSALSHIPEYAHFPVSWINQHVVAFPTWLGGYAKATAPTNRGGMGLSGDEAVAYADKMVRTSHASGAAMNLSRIQNPNNEWAKLGTMFYSYHNTQYQLQRKLVWDANHVNGPGGAGRVFTQGMLLLLVTPMLAGLVTGRYRKADNPEDLALDMLDETLRGLWGGVAYGRDVMNAGLNAVEGKQPDFQLSPIAHVVENVFQGVTDASRLVRREALGDYNAKEPSTRWVQHLVSLPGYFLGWPLMPVGRAAQYVHDVATGAQEPANPAEFAAGMAFGPAAKR